MRLTCPCLFPPLPADPSHIYGRRRPDGAARDGNGAQRLSRPPLHPLPSFLPPLSRSSSYSSWPTLAFYTLQEKDHQIEILTHQLHLLKSRLNESDPEFTSSPPPTPPPSETPPSPPLALISLLRSQITQLIHSNDLLTTENSDLLQTLAQLRSQHATTLSSLSDIQDECDTLKASQETAEREKSEWAKAKEAWEKEKEELEGEYDGEKKKREEVEEVVGVLREKVEEARRGVMRLQAEKRIGGASAPPLNASVGNLGDDLGLPVPIGGGEKTSRADKRASLNVNFGSSTTTLRLPASPPSQQAASRSAAVVPVGR
jgi:hypothetical protein